MRSLLLRKSGNGHCLWYEERKVGPEALRGPSARGHREEKGWPINIFPEMGSGCALLMTVKYVSIWREEWSHLRMEWSQDHSHSVQTLKWSCDFGRHQRTHKKRGPMEPCGEIMKNWYLGKTRKTIGRYFEDFKCLIHTQYIYLAYCQFKNAVSVAVLQNVKAIMSLTWKYWGNLQIPDLLSPPKKNLKKCTITQVKVSSHTNNDPVSDSTEVSEFLYI